MVTKLEAIRAKYPVYNDLSDQQLADAFYNKFYTDTLDKSAFYDQVGLTYSTPENIGRAVTGMPGRMLGSIYGDNMQVQAEQSTAEIEDYKKRFAENRAATDTGFNPLDIITELFGDSEKKYRAQTSLIDFAGTKGLPRPRNEADFEKLNALLRDPAMQQEFIGFLQKQSAVDELKGKLLVQSAEKLVPETRVKPDDWVADLAVQTAASLADMAPTLAVGLATSGAPGTVAGLATLFFQARGTKYKDMRKTDPRAFQTFLADKGFKGSDVGPELAGKVANLYAAFEAIPEAVPLSKLLLGSAKSLGRNLLEYGIIEPGSEVLTELGQIGTDVLVLNENMTNDEVLGRIAQAYVGGLAMSGVYAGVNAVANKVREPQKIDEINRAGPVVGTEFETLVEDNLDATPEQAANPEAPPMLMLPPPDKTEPYLARRQPLAPEIKEQVEPTIDEQAFSTAFRDTQDRFNEQNRKDRTALLARSAKEQLKPIYVTNDEANAGPISDLLGDKLTDIRAKRIRSSRNPDAPITLPELKAAGVSAETIDQIKNLKQPATAALKVMDAEKRGLDPLEFPETVSAPTAISDQPFTEAQYKSAVMAIAEKGRYSFDALKSATGITNASKMAKLKQALILGGQLVESKNGPIPANQMRNERMTVPSDLPEGAVVANVVRELPVGAVRVRQTKNGKTSSLGVFNTLADARAKISSIRAGEDQKGGAGAQLKIEPAGRTAFGVVQKRYDKEGNFIGEVVIDSFATEAEARKAYDRKEETPPAPVSPTAPAAPQQHRVVERQNITGYKLSIDGNERAYPATEEGARQLIQDEAAAPEGAKVERSDVTEPMFELVRDNLNAQGKTVGTSKSMGLTSSRADADAEAARLNSIGTVRDVAPKGLEGRVDEVVAALTRVAEQMGLPRVGGKVVLQNVVTRAGGTEAVEGVFGRDGIIRLTVGHFTPEMTTEEIVAQLSAVLRHEAIHQLRRVGVLMPETGNWNALLNYARNAKDPKGENGETFMARAERMYKGIPGYDTEAVQEEAVAEAFRSWADGKTKPSGKPASIFRKIVDWFRRLIAELPEDVFSRVDSGQLVAERVRSPGASNRRNIDRNRVDIAVKQLREANAVADENAKRVATTEYLAARDQAREDNAGRSGFKTVLGTDANKPYAEGDFMPPEQAAGLVSAYKEKAGLTVDSLPTTLQPNVEFMQKVAKAQERAEHTPNDPLVKRAYAALTTETKTMFNSLGVTVEPWRGNGQPYASAADMGRDIAAGRIKLRMTEEMFGATPSTANHPMRQNSGIAAKDGTALTNNDLFRVVHDIFGYNQIGLRPGYDADFTAYHEHSRLYSDQARRAYATETLAQDAWHHFGPHLWRTDGTVALQNDVDFLPSERKEFAKQKAFLLPEDLLRSDPAFEQIKNAEAGDLEQFSDERFSIAPVNVRQAMKTQGRGLTQTRKVAALPSVFALTGKKKFQTGRELKLAIQKRVKDAADKAGVDLTTQNDQVLYHLVKQGVEDALYALKTNSNAIGWYNRTVNEALEIVALLHPEIKTDQPSRLAFKTALAITSNGLKVNKNFELAEAAYAQWKRTGRMPTQIGIGTAADQIDQSLGLFNRMADDYGYEALERILMSPFTVAQLKRIGFSISGEGNGVVVRGAAVFGPKIGNGFFANLNGKFDALTIDRWLMRTWGRWTGILVERDQANIDRSLASLGETINLLKQDPAAFAAFEAATGVSLNGPADEVATALHDASTDSVVRDQMNAIGRMGNDGDTVGAKLRKGANSAWKYLDGQIEQPSQSQRPFIRAAMDGVLRVLHGQGYNELTMSDLQALLWYPEKRLYDSAKGRADTSGYADDEAPDYANAAAALVASKGVPTPEIANARKIGRENAERETGSASDGRAGAVEQRRGTEPEYAPATVEEAVGRLNDGERSARAKFLKRAIFVEDRIGRERDGAARVYRGKSAGNARNLQGVKTVFTPAPGFKNMLKLAEMPTPVVHELHTTPENAQAFRELLGQSGVDNRFGAAVYLYTPAEYQNFRLFMTEDRTGGFAIKPDGDIVSVFSSDDGQTQPMLSLATEEGGKKLDAFDTVIPDVYDLNGFVETGRTEWSDRQRPTVANGAAKDWDYETFKDFNNGRPDRVFMEYRPATAGQLTDAEARIAERLSVTPVPMTEAQRRVASRLPGGKDYGRADLAPATVLSAPGTPAVALIDNRDGSRYFGGDVADEQLRQAQDGDRGATVTYMTPENFVALAGIDPGKDQQVFDAVPATDYKFNALPSLTFTGDKGIVRVAKSDGAYAARALIGKAASIPVVIYPERGREFGLINGVTNGQTEVLFDNTFPHDYYPERRGERFSVGSEKFQKWFKDSKVVGPGGQPLVLYHGTGKDFTVFDTDKRAGSNIDSGFLGRGAYLTNEPRVADYYAEAGLNAAFSPNVMPVYASLQNPFMWGTKTQGVRGLVSRGERLPEAIHDEVIRRTGFEFDPAMDPDFAAEPGLSQAVTDILREKGYDGVIATFDGVPGEYVAFEPTQIKSAIGNNGNWDAANPDIRYSMNTVGLKVPVSSPVWANDDATDGYVTKMVSQIGRSKTRFLGTSVYDQRVKLQDKFISLEDMAENARRSGGVVNDLNDTYQVQQLSDGRAYYQIQDAEETLYAPLFEAIHEAHKNGVSIDDVETYLLAKHAPERNAFLRSRKSPVKDPSGMSDADAYAFIDKMRTEGKAAQLEAIANLAYKITRDTTRVRIEGGLITAQDAAASPFKFYVPLKGLDPTLLDPDDNTADLRNVIRTGRGYSVSGRESRSPTGRTSKAYNILGHLITQNTEAVLRAEKNRVAVSLVQFIKDNPNSGVGTILKKVPTRLVRSTNGMIRSVPDQQYRSSPDIVIAKVQGREVVMRITDTWVARAMRSDNIPRINKFFQIAGTINRYLATINTAWNPEFLITNLFRDAQTAAILGNRYNIESFSKAIIADAPKAIVAIREVIRTGRVEGEMAQYFDEMRRGGGTTEFLGIKNADQQVKALRGLLADTQLGAAQGKVVKAIKAIGKTVEDYNKVAENALRLAAYANARRAGATVEQAAYISKNLTVNFNKGGEYKGIVNSLYLFYNASLAGSFVLLKGLKNKKVQRIAAGIVAAGFLLDMVNRVLSGDEDDDGIKDYDEIPEYILRTNLIIMRGGKDYIAIPMPYGFNFFHNVGRNISAVVNGSPTKDIVRAVLDSLEAGFDSFNPLGGSGSLLNVIAPTVLDPVVDIVTNRDFANKPIVPERPSFDGLPIPNSQKFWNSTGGMYKDVAAFVNGVAGGNEVIPGAGGFDWSPEILEYAVEYAFGAAGSFVERGANLVNKVATGSFDVKEDFDQIPFLRKTAGTVTSRSNSDRFYTQAEKVMLHDKQIRSAIKLGDSDTARARSEQNPELTQLIPTFKAIDNQLAALRKRRRAIEKNTSLTPEAIREQVKAIREREDALMRQASVEYLKVTGRAD